MLLEKICKELGVEIGKKWLGNDGATYMFDNKGYLYVQSEDETNRMEFIWEATTLTIPRILRGELKPKWKPEIGEKYYIPYIHSKEEERQINYFWDNSRTDKFMWNNNLMFKTKEEAIEATNKILEFLREVN